MTIRELLTKITDEKPHSFPDSKIVQFVNEVEPFLCGGAAEFCNGLP